MPFASEKQRRFMFAEHPDIAHRWAHETKRKKHRSVPRSKRKGSRR